MLKLFQSIFGHPEKASNGYDDALIDRAIEHVVEVTDPRLHTVSGYRRRLRPAVTKAVDYTFELVDGLPVPIKLSRDQFSQDERIRSFFASPEHISEFLTQSPTLQDCLEKQSRLDRENIYALLVLTRIEKKVLGTKMDGDILTREVAQVSIIFSDPRLSHPMDDEHASRFETKKAVFNYFIEMALKSLIATRGEQLKAKQQREILARKLHRLESANWAFGSLFGGGTDKPPVNQERLAEEIGRLEAELKSLETTPITLDKHLETIAQSLNSVRDQLWKTSITVKLDRMGIKVEENSYDAAITLHLNEYCSCDGRKIIALPVYITFDQIPARPDLVTEAKRYL